LRFAASNSEKSWLELNPRPHWGSFQCCPDITAGCQGGNLWWVKGGERMERRKEERKRNLEGLGPHNVWDGSTPMD